MRDFNISETKYKHTLIYIYKYRLLCIHIKMIAVLTCRGAQTSLHELTRLQAVIIIKSSPGTFW